MFAPGPFQLCTSSEAALNDAFTSHCSLLLTVCTFLSVKLSRRGSLNNFHMECWPVVCSALNASKQTLQVPAANHASRDTTLTACIGNIYGHEKLFALVSSFNI